MHQLDKVVTALEPLSCLEQPSPVLLDLSGLVFIGPAALATLASVVHDAIQRGVVEAPSRYVPPTNRLVARYLDRVDFNRLLTGTDVGAEFVRRRADGFRPVQHFVSPVEVSTLADSLAMAATEAMAVSGHDRAAVALAIREIGQNVFDHANSRTGGFAIAQRGATRKEFEIAVADSGIGIPASIRANNEYSQVSRDSVAIERALTAGVTGKPGTQNKGLALAAIREFLRENYGTLLVRSGSGAVEDGHRQSVRDDLSKLRGTVVAIRLRIDRPFELNVFTQSGMDPIDDLQP
jgi:anti-sigma regulatory factor (Ser/Thr protein kinase)